MSCKAELINLRFRRIYDEEEFTMHVGKVHPVSGTKNGKQSRIIKFTTHSFKEKVFLKHKQIKKNDTEKRKQNPKLKSRIQLNVQLSLSRFGIEQLKKQMKPSKIIKTLNLRMPICTVIWNLFWTILLMGNMSSILETKMIL